MDTEYFIIDDSSHREAVEALNKLFPQLQRVSTFALIVETVNSIDGTTLVISAQKEKVFGVLNLVGE